jgi:hypothetical protein
MSPPSAATDAQMKLVLPPRSGRAKRLAARFLRRSANRQPERNWSWPRMAAFAAASSALLWAGIIWTLMRIF